MGQSGLVHDFRTQLAYSEDASEESFWDAVYRKAFPNLVAHVPCLGDVASQRMGIDRAVILENSKTLYIDEKKRRQSYPDILLEFVSVDTTGAPGWMEKDLAIDYLAYAFMDTRKVYLFPWPLLRRAWLHYKDKWLGTYRIVEADNGTYKTKSVAVPIGVLVGAVSMAGVVTV